MVCPIFIKFDEHGTNLSSVTHTRVRSLSFGPKGPRTGPISE
jgi:hypothetical protein